MAVFRAVGYRYSGIAYFVNVSSSLFKHFFYFGRNFFVRELSLFLSRYRKYRIFVRNYRSICRALVHRFRISIHVFADFSYRRILFKNNFSVFVCEYFKRRTFSNSHRSSYFFRYYNSSEVVYTSDYSRCFHF